ncbi:hypothetical protein D9611_013020 [Ephemerocybe angulata]|uniref:Uncharacterized protein n=1 Tax=Ephemerocybe angulata TaxID=980116 RepID=A0A8H5AW06_9AGAR|nr:hypothetical protein D9611_013020 [Tulosesus angulatus]
MRFTSLVALVPLAASLATLATARGYEYNDARDYIDELSLREYAEELSTRELLSELSTRELIDELSDRLERRTKYGTCKNCDKKNVIKGDSCSKQTGGHVLKAGTIVDKREFLEDFTDGLERRTKYGTCKNCDKKNVIKGDSCSKQTGGHVLKAGTIVDKREFLEDFENNLERRTKYGTCKNCDKKNVIKGDSCSKQTGGHVLKAGTIVDK